jgi:glutaredoxin 3
MKIIMYTRSNPPCPYCVQAKALAESKGYSYTNIDIGKDISREEFMDQFPGAKTVPLIIIDGEVVGGFTDFKNYVLSKTLGEMTI